MLTTPSCTSQNPFRKFQKYVCVSNCHCHKAFFIKSLFIAYKNDEWCHFVMRIGSPVLI